MMLDLISQLRLLTIENAELARQIGLVNVDRIVVNGSIVIATGIAQSDGRCNISNCNDRAMQDKGSAIIKLDDEKQSTSASQDSKSAEPTAPLPIRFGVYIRLEDPKWWVKAPEFLDIAKALRVRATAYKPSDLSTCYRSHHHSGQIEKRRNLETDMDQYRFSSEMAV